MQTPSRSAVVVGAAVALLLGAIGVAVLLAGRGTDPAAAAAGTSRDAPPPQSRVAEVAGSRDLAPSVDERAAVTAERPALAVLVVDRAGAPVGRADVVILAAGPPREAGSADAGQVDRSHRLSAATTATDGTAALALPTARWFYVEATRTGFGVSETVLVNAEQHASPVRLDLRPVATVRGLVRDEDADPVAGVEVRPRTAARYGGPPTAGRTRRPASTAATSDSAGEFSLRVEAGLTWTIVGRKDGALTDEVELDGPEDGATIEVLLTLQRGVRVRGTVLDDAGRPVAGEPVYLWDPTPTRPGSGATGLPGAMATTDGGGRYAMLVARAGSYVIACAPADRPPTAEVAVELPESAPAPIRVDLRLLPEARIAGTVFDPMGQPVTGAQVFAYHPADGHSRREATTGPDGRFVVQGLVRDIAYSLSCRPRPEQHPLLEQRGIAWTAGSGELSIRLEPRYFDPCRADLRVLDGATGKAIPTFVYKLVVFEHGRTGLEPHRADRDDGVIALDGLVEGERYAVDVTVRGIGTIASEPWIATAAKHEATVWIAPKAELEVRVDVGGWQHDHLRLVVRSAGGDRLATRRLDPDGVCRWQAAPGRYRVALVRLGSEDELATTEVSLGAAGAHVQMTAPRGERR